MQKACSGEMRLKLFKQPTFSGRSFYTLTTTVPEIDDYHAFCVRYTDVGLST